MPDPGATSRIRLTGARDRDVIPFDLRAAHGTCAALSRELGLDAVRKLRFTGTLTPFGREDWRLEGTLGATIMQTCGITLAPVTTRIDEQVRRRYLAELDGVTRAEEQEMPDEEDEPLPPSLDLEAVMMEALSLAVPAFPRAEGADMGTVRAAEPGATHLDDDAMKPFAGLAEKLKSTKP